MMNILKNKKYISSIYNIEAKGSILIPNNNAFSIIIELSENGLKNIRDVLLIIYKYINIIKKEGYKKEYFLNFIKFRQNQNNKDFQRKMFNLLTTYSGMIKSYRAYGTNQIINHGTPTYADYDKFKLKNLLSKIKFEKSFFIINTSHKASKINSFLENKEIKTLKYYNHKYLYGKIPNDLKLEILDNKIQVEKLTMRNINRYFSEKYEKDIPCYKY